MKCANCHKEFGHKEYCQYCGIDKIAGLANYFGYIAPDGDHQIIDSNNRENMNSQQQYLHNNNLCCYECGEIIPGDSKFCPVCGINLWKICPKCHHIYSSKYIFCNQCGTNHDEYIETEGIKEDENNKILSNEEEEDKTREYQKYMLGEYY